MSKFAIDSPQRIGYFKAAPKFARSLKNTVSDQQSAISQIGKIATLC
jgi:hypothetical protein